MPKMKVTKLAFLACLLGLSLLACGQHEGSNRSFRNEDGVIVGKDANTPEEKMLEAIDTNEFKQVVSILNGGLSVDTRLANGRTLLIHATTQTKYQIMAELMKRGADVNLTDDQGKTALDYAVAYGEDGAPIYNRAWVILDPSVETTQRKELMKYAGRGSSDFINKLLQEVGINPNFVDETGDTPLTIAIRKKKINGVTTLLAWQDCPQPTECLRLTATDVNFPEAQGHTPLKVALDLLLTEAPGPGADTLNRIIDLLVRNGGEELVIETPFIPENPTPTEPMPADQGVTP